MLKFGGHKLNYVKWDSQLSVSVSTSGQEHQSLNIHIGTCRPNCTCVPIVPGLPCSSMYEQEEAITYSQILNENNAQRPAVCIRT